MGALSIFPPDPTPAQSHVLIDNPVIALLSKTRTDTYTAPANGVTIDLTLNPLKVFSIQARGVGATATSWTIVLEGSLDNINFTTILSHTNVVGDGVVLYSGTLSFPTLYMRSRCTAVVLGASTGITTTILGTL